MIPRRRSFAFEELPELELVVGYQAGGTPTDGEWASYVRVLERLHRARKQYRYFTYSEGGYPSRAQQAAVGAVTQGAKSAVSMVSPSITLRFVGALLALTNPKVQCFGPDQLDAAFAHIGLKVGETERVHACLAALRAKVYGRTEAA